ncbi:MAG: low temperature requirement protein A [Caulobacteraceae bacterium]|nr:MAG: low temperature requirement protein A [Caulobacteraceae bacterium]
MLRPRTGHHAPVGNVELFFDLIFVFAITQLSHSLIEHPTAAGLLHTALLLGAVWWVWIDTAWVTNWLDVDRPLMRGVLFILMGAGLVMSAALPKAFGDNGVTFGLALAFFQIFRTGFTLWAVRGDRVLRENFQRILVWHAAAALLWAAGGFAPEQSRLWVWLAALAVDSIAPALNFRVPGLGRSHTGDWTVEGHHLSERLSLFTIIALGESILVMGATAAGLDWSWTIAAALLVSFVGSVAMWWIYFSAAAGAATEAIAGSSDPGRIARLAYTYVHIIPIAGIIVTAVGDEWVLHHPLGHTDPKTALAVLGGPALYLLGVLLFKLAIFGKVSPSRLAGLVMLAAAAPFSLMLPPLALGAIATGVLIVVAAWETIALRRGATSA